MVSAFYEVVIGLVEKNQGGSLIFLALVRH